MKRQDKTRDQLVAELAEARRRVDELAAEQSARRRAEVELRASEQRLRELFEDAPDAYALVSQDGTLVEVNEMTEQIRGYAKSELVGKNVLQLPLIQPEDRQRLLAILARTARGHATGAGEFVLRRKDGTQITVETRMHRLTMDGESLILAIARDVTESKRAEAERERLLRQLRDANQRLTIATAQRENLTNESRRHVAELRGIINSMVDAVLVTDETGQITFINEAGRRLLGVQGPQELQRVRIQCPTDMRMRHLDGTPVQRQEMPMVRALAGEVVATEEHIIDHPQTHRPVRIRTSATPIIDDEGKVIGEVAVVRDVTELVEMDKLKDDFLRFAAHELRTPVTIMKGYAQALLRTSSAKQTEQRRVLESINSGADRINRTINDMLDISRLQLGHIELTKGDINLSTLVRNEVSEMTGISPRHTIRLLQVDPALVRGDSEKLRQVLEQLIDNAIKHSPAGGQIDLALRVRNQEAIISVRDQGIGIPKAKQPHVFERFYRAHAGTPYNHAVMGVGLYVSQEIVKAHGDRM